MGTEGKTESETKFETKPEKVCYYCSKSSAPLQHCSKCKVAVYCSRDHQAVDWKRAHKLECVHLSALDATTKTAIAWARSKSSVQGSVNFCIDCVCQEKGILPHKYMGADGGGAYNKLGIDRMALRDHLGFASWEVKLLIKYQPRDPKVDSEAAKIAQAWNNLAKLAKTADARLMQEENIDTCRDFGEGPSSD